MRVKYLFVSGLAVTGISALNLRGTSSAVNVGIENSNSNSIFVPTGLEFSGASCKDACYTTLSPYAQQWFKLSSASSWVVASYNLCEKVIYDEDGNPSCDGYQMHIDATVTPTKVTVVASDGAVSVKKSKDEDLYAITGTPNSPEDDDAPECELPAPTVYSEHPLRGVNIAGAEFETPVFPGVCDVEYYINEGMNTIRFPFAWEYMQPDLSKAIDWTSGYAAQYAALVQKWTDAGYTVVIDMHNYMQYNDQVIGAAGSEAAQADYANAWGQIAAQFRDNSNVIFGLMNEPVAIFDGGTELVLANENAAVAEIRKAGAEQPVLYSGNSWDNGRDWCANWYGTPNSEVFNSESMQDPLNNKMLELHMYLNANGNVPEDGCVDPSQAVSVQNPDCIIDWLGKNPVRVLFGETGGTESNDCVEGLNNVLGWAFGSVPNFGGFTAWAGGSAWPESYPLLLNPEADKTERPQMTGAIENFLENSPEPTSAPTTTAPTISPIMDDDWTPEPTIAPVDDDSTYAPTIAPTPAPTAPDEGSSRHGSGWDAVEIGFFAVGGAALAGAGAIAGYNLFKRGYCSTNTEEYQRIERTSSDGLSI